MGSERMSLIEQSNILAAAPKGRTQNNIRQNFKIVQTIQYDHQLALGGNGFTRNS